MQEKRTGGDDATRQSSGMTEEEPPPKRPAKTIRCATPPDVEGILQCHLAAFPDSTSTQIGDTYLKALFRYYVGHPQGITLVAVGDDGRILGLAMGGPHSIGIGFQRRARIRYPHILLWRFLTNRLVRRRMLLQFWGILRGKLPRVLGGLPEGLGNGGHPMSAGRVCGLGSIGVLPESRGTGIAGDLLQAFQAVAEEQGYDQLRLNVLSDNPRAIAFYRKHGWQGDTPQTDRVVSYRMVLALGGGASNQA